MNSPRDRTAGFNIERALESGEITPGSDVRQETGGTPTGTSGSARTSESHESTTQQIGSPDLTTLPKGKGTGTTVGVKTFSVDANSAGTIPGKSSLDELTPVHVPSPTAVVPSAPGVVDVGAKIIANPVPAQNEAGTAQVTPTQRLEPPGFDPTKKGESPEIRAQNATTQGPVVETAATASVATGQAWGQGGEQKVAANPVAEKVVEAKPDKLTEQGKAFGKQDSDAPIVDKNQNVFSTDKDRVNPMVAPSEGMKEEVKTQREGPKAPQEAQKTEVTNQGKTESVRADSSPKSTESGSRNDKTATQQVETPRVETKSPTVTQREEPKREAERPTSSPQVENKRADESLNARPKETAPQPSSQPETKQPQDREGLRKSVDSQPRAETQAPQANAEKGTTPQRGHTEPRVGSQPQTQSETPQAPKSAKPDPVSPEKSTSSVENRPQTTPSGKEIVTSKPPVRQSETPEPRDAKAADNRAENRSTPAPKAKEQIETSQPISKTKPEELQTRSTSEKGKATTGDSTSRDIEASKSGRVIVKGQESPDIRASKTVVVSSGSSDSSKPKDASSANTKSEGQGERSQNSGARKDASQSTATEVKGTPIPKEGIVPAPVRAQIPTGTSEKLELPVAQAKRIEDLAGSRQITKQEALQALVSMLVDADKLTSKLIAEIKVDTSQKLGQIQGQIDELLKLRVEQFAKLTIDKNRVDQSTVQQLIQESLQELATRYGLTEEQRALLSRILVMVTQSEFEKSSQDNKPARDPELDKLKDKTKEIDPSLLRKATPEEIEKARQEEINKIREMLKERDEIRREKAEEELKRLLEEQSDLETDYMIDEDLEVIKVYRITGETRDTLTKKPIPGVTIVGGLLGSRVSASDGLFEFLNIPSGTSFILGADSYDFKFKPSLVVDTLNMSVHLIFEGTRIV